MSPRAAWRLEALGFEHVADYVGGKADWLAHGLPREGTNAAVPTAGDLLDTDPPTCGLHDGLADAGAMVERSPYGFCVVVNEQRIVLGRLRRSALEGAAADATVETAMEPGPSTVRPDTPRRELVARLARKNLTTAVVTTPEGQLLGVFAPSVDERRLQA